MLGQMKKCQLCEHRSTCIKISEHKAKYGNRLNPLSEKLVESKICKQIKFNPDVMKRLINLAMISTYGATGNYLATIPGGN